MKSFFLLLCLVVLWTLSDSSAAEVVNITIVQHPPSVEVGKNVTLTCNATAERKITELEWFDNALKQALRKTDTGVVDLLEPALGELSVSSVLMLSVKDKNGDGWPKTVQCRVVLEPADSNGILYKEIHEVVVTAPTTPSISQPTTSVSTPTEAATVGVVQNPDSVEVGDNVALTCSATAVRHIKKLEWIDTATDRVLRREDEGVVDLQQPDLTLLNVSNVLTLSTNIKNGEKWPKSVTCKVELPKKEQVNGRFETYEAPYNLVVTGSAIVSVVQEPPSVQVGNNVTFSCSATAEKKIKTLKWIANGVDLRQLDDGVVYFPQPGLEQLSVSTALTLLSRANKKGEKWPKNIKCQVELEFEKGTKHSDTYFDILEVKFTEPKAPSLKLPTKQPTTTKPTSPTKPPPGANITVVQDPEPVAVGQNVTLTCNATAVQKIKALNWTVDDKLLHPADKGVVDLLQPALGELSVSSVLTLSVKSENGDQWPETVQCMVVLELEQNVSETYNVTVKATESPPTATPTTTRSTVTQPNTVKDDTTQDLTSSPTTTPGSVGIAAVAVAIVVVLVLGGVVFMVYWKRHTLRDWLMDKDVVKVMKKGKRGKGYKYSKLPKDISTSMKHLE